MEDENVIPIVEGNNFIDNSSNISDSLAFPLDSTPEPSLMVNETTETLLEVTSFTPTASGFEVTFNRAIDGSLFHLYDENDLPNSSPNVAIADESENLIRGSVILKDDLSGFIFVKTGDILAPGNYSVTLSGDEDGIVDINGQLLDGNSDGTPGGDYSNEFTITNNSERVLSLPDIVRMNGQSLIDPETDQQLSLEINNGEGLTNIELELNYDSNLLTIDSLEIAEELPDSWQLESNFSEPGIAQINLSGTEALTAETQNLILINGNVPEIAVYGSNQALTVNNIRLNSGSITGIGDSAIHQVSLFGDASGDGRYNSLDSYLIAKASTGLINRFDAYKNTDLNLISDIDSNLFISAFDSYKAIQQSEGQLQPEYPDLSNIRPIFPGTENLTRLFPPRNQYLADSPWPIYHRDNYAQASTPIRGPEAGDQLEIQTIPTQLNGASPWSNLSQTYADGTQTVWGSTLTHVFKILIDGENWQLIDSQEISGLDSISWNNLLLEDNKLIVADPEERILYRLADSDPNDPRSPIAIEGEFSLPAETPGRFTHFSLTYDGWIILITHEGYLNAVKPDFSQVVTYDLSQTEGDINWHNAFPIDENGGIYLASQQALTKVQWNSETQTFSTAWRVPYNFRAEGCPEQSNNQIEEGIRFLLGGECSGSGTTPTLMGVGEMDRLVLTVDGDSPQNNLVAFWRDEIPEDWVGLPGQDRRVAAITPLPYATSEGQGFNTENSPVVYGYEVAVAQYNGLRPSCQPLGGVQKLLWNPTSRQLELVWANEEVSLNNVLTYSVGSDLLYGSGRKDCSYHFYGLDWDSGETVLDLPMGDDEIFLDQGNQVTINSDRSIIFGGLEGHVRIRVVP
jgi:hypothetical protein